MNSPHYAAILYFIKSYKALYGSILVLTLASSVVESASIAAFFPVFSSLMNESPEKEGGFLGFVARIAGLLPIASPLIAASMLVLGLFLLRTFLTLGREWLIAYGSSKVVYNAKQAVIERYANTNYQYFIDNQQGALQFNLLAAPSSVGSLLRTLPQTASHLFRGISLLILLAIIFPVAALALAVLGLAYYGIIHILSRKISFQLGQGKLEAGTEEAVVTNEFLSGIRQITTLGAIRRWVDRFDQANKLLSNIQAKDQTWVAVTRPVMEFSAVALMLGFLLILWMIDPSSLVEGLPRLGVFAVAMMQLLPALTAVGRARMEVLGVLPYVDRTYQLVTGAIPPRGDGTKTLESFEKAIVFDNVSFGYPNRSLLLNDVNMSFEKGKVTAIVGPSGAGKTTIINLILTLFVPSKGRITVSSIPLNELKRDSWFARIGFVSQEPFTFHSTIADNIVFGRGEYSLKAITQAAKTANAHEFISELSQGYDTVVGERGMRLSGGQQQRIAIARAVLNEPEILIFDEATSSLDNISEKQVQQAIDNVSNDRTVILIAHRLSTVRHADKIIVIDEGQVVEEGSHQELLNRQGHYSGLVAASLR